MKNPSAQLLPFFGLIMVLVLINIIGNTYFFRIDLTADKRYSISKATKKMLFTLPDKVFVEVYLEGEFPAGFQRLQKTIKETLTEFKSYAGASLDYTFVDPSAAPDAKTRNQTYKQLTDKGLQPTNLTINENEKRSEKIIFPAAIIRSGSREIPVLLLKGNQSASSQERLNQSVEGVEYELASAIAQATQPDKKRIAIIQGHGELDGSEFYDLGISLKKNYIIEPVLLSKKINLEGYDAIIVADPDSVFSEPDKFKIDQFIINGGKALFFVDKIKIALDSLSQNNNISFASDLHLDDMFFKYGLRINPDLVMDMSSAYIPMITGYMGDKTQTQLMPWRFYPIINKFAAQPITRNMDALYLRSTSTIDTVRADNISKTPLIFSSKYTRIVPAPVRISLNDAKLEPQPAQYRHSFLALAYLLEGKFHSLYTNRLAPISITTFKFVPQNQASSVLICSDGDLPRNEINRSRNQIYPLGYDRFSGMQFANKDFILNALAYMLDKDGIILARNKTISLRPLDKPRIEADKAFWQSINLILPLLLILISSFVKIYFRDRKYAK